jgi:hypothetical protein
MAGNNLISSACCPSVPHSAAALQPRGDHDGDDYGWFHLMMIHELILCDRSAIKTVL